MPALTQEQEDGFWNDGVLLVDTAVTAREFESLRTVSGGWVEESHAHTDDYGVTLDDRPRFDIQLPEFPKATSFFAQQEWANNT